MTTDTPTRAELVEALARRQDLKALIKGMQDELDNIDAMLRAALEADPTPIVDGERGLAATLVERNRPAEVDLISFAEKPEHEALLARAARMGLLRANLTALRGQKGKADAADALLRFEMPGGVNRVLNVEQTR
jgi:hypothetical protein